MEREARTPGAALDLGDREHVVMVGGGGKSTLLCALCRELGGQGVRVAAATTTKVWHCQAVAAGPVVLTDEDGWQDRLEGALGAGKTPFLGRRLLPTGKVEGVVPKLADALFARGRIDRLLVEGDGAAGRPLKAPRPGEPVVPASATRVVAVAGLEALGRPMGSDTVFRMDRFQEITGAAPGERLTVSILTRLFARPEGLFKNCPESAQRSVFLNQLDLADPREACSLADRLLSDPDAHVRHVVLGSLRDNRYLTLSRT